MRIFCYLALMLLFSACGDTQLSASGEMQPPLAASDVVVTASMPGMQMSAGYLTLTNNTDSDIVVTRVTSPQFGRVEMHETVIENDVARMRKLEELVVPANGQVSFERGGKHLMLMQPASDGDAVTLNIYSAEAVLMSVTTLKQAR